MGLTPWQSNTGEAQREVTSDIREEMLKTLNKIIDVNKHMSQQQQVRISGEVRTEHRGYGTRNFGHYRNKKPQRKRLSREDNNRVKELLGRRRRALQRRDKEIVEWCNRRLCDIRLGRRTGESKRNGEKPKRD